MAAKNFKVVKKEYQAGIHTFNTVGSGDNNIPLDTIINSVPLTVLSIKGSNIGIGITNPIVSLDTNRTDAYKLPSGSLLDRPSGVEGYIRYNNESQQFEGFGAGNQWGSLGGVKSVLGDTYILAEYSAGNDDKSLHFYTSNIEQMSLISNGNLGIGTTNPQYKLDVSGNAYIDGPLIVNNSITSTSFIGTATQVSQTLVRGNYLTGSNYNGSISTTWSVDATTDASVSKIVARDITGYIYTNGVGIGTTIARQTLDVQNGDVIFSNNLGIGTTTPYVALEIWASNAVLLPKGSIASRPIGVQGYIRYNTESLQFEGFGAGNQWGSLGGVKSVSGDTYILAEYSAGNDDKSLHFYTSNIEQMSLISNGNLGIGTTNPQYKLDVSGNAYIDGPLIINDSITTNNNNINAGSGTITATIFSGTATQVSQILTRGDYLTGNNYNGGTATTWAVDATTDAIANKIVARDVNAHIYAANIGIGTGFAKSTLHVEKGAIFMNGNVGIGTIIPRYTLDINGDLQATKIYTENMSLSNLTVTGSYFLANDNQSIRNTLQITPLRITQQTTNSSTSNFIGIYNGLYKALPETTEVYVNGYKMAYYSPTNKDYDVTYELNNIIYQSTFSVTLEETPAYGDVVDIIIWPQYLDPNGLLQPGYILQNINYSLWRQYQNGCNIYYTDGNVGIGTVLPMYPLEVASKAYIKTLNSSNIYIEKYIVAGAKIGINTNLPYTSLDIRSTDAVLLPRGTTSERPSGIQGFIRYNTETYQFEGLGAADQWGSLGGVKSTNQQTYISAELTPGTNDGNIRFYNENSLNMILNPSGNLGIGTNNPIEKLHVVGNIYSTGNIIASNLRVIGDFVTMNTITSNTEQIVITNDGTGPALKVSQTGLNSIAEFYDNETGIAMIIADNGNIGIGTSEPINTFHVVGNSSFTGNIFPSSSYIYDLGSSNLRWRDIYLSGTTIDLDNTKITKDNDTGGIHIIPYGYSNQYSKYILSTSNVILPSSVGTINGVNITALNKRTRTSYASAYDTIKVWTSRISSVDNNWQSVCWAPELSLFCAVASSGTGDRIMTSPDGIKWSTQTSPVNNDWTSVCWAPELSLFCAVASTGSGDRVMTSSDGVTWTAGTSILDNGWQSVCWAAELSIFVAVGINSGTGYCIMTSFDGITWTPQSFSVYNSWCSVCWASELSLLVAVSDDGTNRIMTSSDGIIWIDRIAPVNNSWKSVCWAGELSIFVAVSSTGTNQRVMTSSDGINWTAINSPVDNSWWSVCWSAELSIFVAIGANAGTGKRIMTSPNGIIWTSQSAPANIFWRGICWAPELSIFTAVAQTGTDNRVMTSAIGMPNSKNVIKAFSNQIMVDAQGNIGIGTTTPYVALEIWASNAILLPKGNNASRPITSVQGYIRYNTESFQFEGYGAGNVWGSLGGVKSVVGDTYILAEYSPGNDDKSLHFYTNSIERMTLTSSGNLGIGTTTPRGQLEVFGDVYTDYRIITSNLTVLGNLGFGPGTSTIRNNLQINPIRKLIYISTETSNNFDATTPGIFGGYASNVQIFKNRTLLTYYSDIVKDYDVSLSYTDSITNYRIALTTPAVFGDIIDITVWPQIIQQTAAEPGYVYQQIQQITDSYFRPNGNNIGYTNGNVGIGTLIPSQKLHVEGNILASGTITCSNLSVIGNFTILNTLTSNTEQLVIENAGTGPALKVTQTGNQPIADFYDNGTALAMRIANGGNVGIGTTVPQSLLHVFGSSNTNALTLGTATMAVPTGSMPMFVCRAWVNFDGTLASGYKAAGNVASVVRGTTGVYTITFTTAMTSTNYACIVTFDGGSTSAVTSQPLITKNTTNVVISCFRAESGSSTIRLAYNSTDVNVSIFL